MSLSTQERIEAASSLEELVDAVGEANAFAAFKSALCAKENQRVAHKTAYLKRQARNKRVEAELKARGIDIDTL
jgi:hypothetical protein